ncbi:hypothetical protein Y695_00454 [Hydrogenophaga sp. T4]|nr:hypothetical protein Y695_00454 [Hydrogenophaga sp. T4]
MIPACYANGYRKLCIILFHRDLAWAKQFKLQTATQTCLIDVRQQGIHFCLTGKLFLQLINVLLNLLKLFLQRIQIDGLNQFLSIVFSQLLFAGLLSQQLLINSLEPKKPKTSNNSGANKYVEKIPRQRWPGRRVIGIKAGKLPLKRISNRFEIEVDSR